jgi:hypothetical protein
MSTAAIYGPFPEVRCPQCDYELTSVSNALGKGAPDRGDVSLCLNCGQLLIFDRDICPRKASAGEVRELMKDPVAWAVIERMQRLITQRGRYA